MYFNIKILHFQIPLKNKFIPIINNKPKDKIKYHKKINNKIVDKTIYLNKKEKKVKRKRRILPF